MARVGWICLSLSLLLAGGYFLYPPLESLTERNGDARKPVETVEIPAVLEHSTARTSPAHAKMAAKAAMWSPAPKRTAPKWDETKWTEPQRAVLLTPATPIRETAPEAPEGIRNRIIGVIPIGVTVEIGRDGRVVRARAPEQYDGVHAYFAQSAIEAVRQWRFQPAKRGREPVPSESTIRFRFYRSGVAWN